MIRVALSIPGTTESAVLELDVTDGHTRAQPVLHGSPEAVRRVRHELGWARGFEGRELGPAFSGRDLALALQGPALSPFTVRWLEGEEVVDRPRPIVGDDGELRDDIAASLAYLVVFCLPRASGPDPGARQRVLEMVQRIDERLEVLLGRGASLDGVDEAFLPYVRDELALRPTVPEPPAEITAGHDLATLATTLLGAFVGDGTEPTLRRLLRFFALD